MNPSRPVSRKRLSAVVGTLIIMLAVGILLVPGSISTAWVFMPDMVILLVTCATSLALAGMMQLVLVVREWTASQI